MANVLYSLDDGHRNINNVVGRRFDCYLEAIAWGRSQLAGSPFVVADGPRQYLVSGENVWEYRVARPLPLQMNSPNRNDSHPPAPEPSNRAAED